jgi:hypothetical protein
MKKLVLLLLVSVTVSAQQINLGPNNPQVKGFLQPGMGGTSGGAWINTATYGQGAVVTYQGANYVALALNIGVTPGTNPTYWGPAQISSAPLIGQTVIQPSGTSLNVNNLNGVFNEEVFTGSSLVTRMNAAITACGTLYTQSCFITIPTYAPSGIGWNVPPNNVIIIDQRVNNGAGIFSNGQTDPLPQLHGLYNSFYTVGANDPSETITVSATVLGCSIVSNVASCTTSSPNNLTSGEAILIANMANTPVLNSNLNTGTTYSVSATGLSATTFQFAVTATNQAFVADSGIVGAPCTFCGKNVFSMNVNATGGATTNGSNASIDNMALEIVRQPGSTRQATPLVLGVTCNLDGNPAHFCEGLEIDTSNHAAFDDTGLSGTALRIVNVGSRWGIGLQLTDVGGTPAAGWEYGIAVNNYHINGIQLSSGDTTSNADIAIIPPANDHRMELQGLNAADNATIWSIDDSGVISTSSTVSTNLLAVVGGITNAQGMEHFRGASCTTAATINALCTTTITWPVAMGNANYTASCTLESIVGLPVINGFTAKTATTATIQISAITAVVAGGTLNCIVVHD